MTMPDVAEGPGWTLYRGAWQDGTTLLAAVIEGRRAIGAERDPATFAKAVARLRRGFTPAF